MTEAPKLKPCPFCGDTMQVNLGGNIVHVEQGDCVLGQMGWPDLHAHRWNRRDDAEVQRFVAKARAERVTVKPLEWEQEPDATGFKAGSCFSAVTHFDQVYTVRGDWMWPPKDGECEAQPHADPKAAAQADYERRILSALANGGRG